MKVFFSKSSLSASVIRVSYVLKTMTHQHNCWFGYIVKRRQRWLGSSSWPSHGTVAKSRHGDDTPHWGRSSLSHGIFDHTTIALFNVVSCLWNCAMTLCTESGYDIPVSKWCGTLGNCAMILSTETVLRLCLLIVHGYFAIFYNGTQIKHYLLNVRGFSIFFSLVGNVPKDIVMSYFLVTL